ncbi:MAG TPA: hypothetical protein VIB48_04270 [Acidimicrobiia bacterium]|jgi:hypothetical protein
MISSRQTRGPVRIGSGHIRRRAVSGVVATGVTMVAVLAVLA